ncbi:hypothetical protein HMPREF9466_02244 [Fusobacterium necrophorum subsp. funduliforme 1_1_36S]|nr:hypothetical protein HMPREF9466_02244 [Fusobacterium necrophorum subsp. funduliforme 1_1_36S]
MARPATKLDFISVTNENYEKLLLLMSQLTEEELSTTFDFSNDEKRKRHIGNGIKILEMF